VLGSNDKPGAYRANVATIRTESVREEPIVPFAKPNPRGLQAKHVMASSVQLQQPNAKNDTPE
jgi:hypothetical protein